MLIFTESAPRPIQSSSRNVCVSVCVFSVCVLQDTHETQDTGIQEDPERKRDTVYRESQSV